MKHEELLKLSTEQLVTMVEGLDKTFAGKEQELQGAKKDIEGLNQKVTDLTKELSGVQTELKSTVKVNEALAKKIEKLPKTKEPKEPSFTVDGVEYGFNYHRTVLSNAKITHEDVLKDEAIQRELITRKSGMIKEIATS